jgi:hypothetical protein
MSRVRSTAVLYGELCKETTQQTETHRVAVLCWHPAVAAPARLQRTQPSCSFFQLGRLPDLGPISPNYSVMLQQGCPELVSMHTSALCRMSGMIFSSPAHSTAERSSFRAAYSGLRHKGTKETTSHSLPICLKPQAPHRACKALLAGLVCSCHLTHTANTVSLTTSGTRCCLEHATASCECHS